MNRSFFIIFAYFCTVKQKNRLMMEQLSKKNAYLCNVAVIRLTVANQVEG